MAIPAPIFKTQPQIAQLEILFNGPLIKNSVVDLLTDLLALNVNYNYDHKMVWVKERQSNYYLISGNGTNINNWKELTARLTIEQYVPDREWFENEIVYISNRIYKAIQNVPINTNPLDNGLYWLLITGEIITYRYVFNNVSSVIIYASIKNPIFQIITGTLEINSDDEYVLDTDGLIKIENQEFIEAHILKRDDLPNNNGKAYQIMFEENLAPINLTGVINVK